MGAEVGEIGDGEDAEASAAGRVRSVAGAKWVSGAGRRWRSEVVVERGAEGGGDLGGGSGEGDAVAAAGDGVDGEALLLEPGFGGGDVGVGDAEAGGELVGGEPLVIERRGGILLGGEEGVEVGLLGGGAAEDEGDAVERVRRGRRRCRWRGWRGADGSR